MGGSALFKCSLAPGGGREGKVYPIMRLQTESVTLKEMLLGTWIRRCNKGPRPLFKIQPHNRRLKRHLMNGIMGIIYSGARGFLGSRSLLNDCRALRLVGHPGAGSTGVQAPSPSPRRAVTRSWGRSQGNGWACDSFFPPPR